MIGGDRVAVVLIAVVALCACAAKPPESPKFGNFGGVAPGYEIAIARDTVTQIAQVFEPARVRLNMRQPTPDGFGVVLVAGLRERGYAVSEYAGEQPAQGTESPERMTRDQREDAGIDFHYVVDRPDPDVFRVSVIVAQRTLSRAYTLVRGDLLPYGAWVVQE